MGRFNLGEDLALAAPRWRSYRAMRPKFSILAIS
jgi:hypothetical protein